MRLRRRAIASYEQIIYTKDAGVATITLNRPQVLNAFTPIMIDEWVQAIEAAKLDPKVRVVVATGRVVGFALALMYGAFVNVSLRMATRLSTGGIGCSTVCIGYHWPYVPWINLPSPPSMVLRPALAWTWLAWRISASPPKRPDSP